MNMFKKKNLILPAVISTSFLVSCTHVFESKNTEIDLSVFRNIKTNIESISANLEQTTSVNNNNDEIMKLAIESIARDINNQNRVYTKKISPSVNKNFVKNTKQEKTIQARNNNKKLPLVEAKISEISDLPSHEIGLIQHNGFNGEIKNRINFDKLNWTLPVEKDTKIEANKDDIVTDTIKTASASAQVAKKSEDASEDEIKVFDYNEPSVETSSTETASDSYKAPEDLQFEVAKFENSPGIKLDSKIPKYAEARLSSSVLNVIRRETNYKLKDKNKDRFLIQTNENLMDLADKESSEDVLSEPSVYEIADKVSKESSSSLKKPINQKELIKNAFTEMPIEGAEKISYKILAREVAPGVKTAEAYGFEFIPHYDRNDRMPDSSGEINLEYSVLGSQNVVSGLVLKQGYVDIQTDLDLDSTNLKTVIPLVEVEKFEKFLQTNKLSTAGSYILVNTTKGYTDIDVDGVVAQKVLLTSKFSIVKKDEEPTFILVTGVSLGNNFVKLKTESGWTQKVLNTQENMITYVDEEFRESVNQSLELYTETKTGKVTELNTSNAEFKLLSSKNSVRKISTNKIAFKTQENVNTQKNYLEIKKESTTFIGLTGDESEITIPTQREKELIMTEFGVSDLQNSCIIQVNSSEDIQRFRAGGPSDIGEIYTQVLYSDREGNISNELSEWTNKAYILGDRVGVLNIQIEYPNGAVKMTNSYCSNDVYIVENL